MQLLWQLSYNVLYMSSLPLVCLLVGVFCLDRNNVVEFYIKADNWEAISNSDAIYAIKEGWAPTAREIKEFV